MKNRWEAMSKSVWQNSQQPSPKQHMPASSYIFSWAISLTWKDPQKARFVQSIGLELPSRKDDGYLLALACDPWNDGFCELRAKTRPY
jgi:hypothetical protein